MHPCEGNTSPFGLQSQEALLVGASEDTGRCHGRTGQRDPLHQGDRTARSQGCHLRSRTVPGDLIADRPWACRSPAALPNPASRGVVSRPLVEPALPQGWVRLHVHSPLLVQSWLRSSPLPTDMLKLGRSLCAPSGCWIGSPHHRSRFWGGEGARAASPCCPWTTDLPPPGGPPCVLRPRSLFHSGSVGAVRGLTEPQHTLIPPPSPFGGVVRFAPPAGYHSQGWTRSPGNGP